MCVGLSTPDLSGTQGCPHQAAVPCRAGLSSPLEALAPARSFRQLLWPQSWPGARGLATVLSARPVLCQPPSPSSEREVGLLTVIFVNCFKKPVSSSWNPQREGNGAGVRKGAGEGAGPRAHGISAMLQLFPKPVFNTSSNVCQFCTLLHSRGVMRMPLISVYRFASQKHFFLEGHNLKMYTGA